MSQRDRYENEFNPDALHIISTTFISHLPLVSGVETKSYGVRITAPDWRVYVSEWSSHDILRFEDVLDELSDAEVRKVAFYLSDVGYLYFDEIRYDSTNLMPFVTNRLKRGGSNAGGKKFVEVAVSGAHE